MPTRRSSMLTCLVSAAALLAGCVSHDYIGETYAPTEEVRVFFDQAAVPEGYLVMGEDRATASADVDSQSIIADMVKHAQKVGADAILVTGVETMVTGASTSTTGSAYSTGDYYSVGRDGRLRRRAPRDVQWYESTSTTTLVDKTISAKYLRRADR